MPGHHDEAERFRYFVLAAYRQGQRLMSEQMKAIGVTPSQTEVIRVLSQWQPISLKELGFLLVCEEGSPSRLVERMAADGLIKKLPNPNDARYLLLKLTAKGQEKAGLIQEFEEKLYADLEQLYTNDELVSVNEALAKMLSPFSIADTLRNRKLWPDAPVGDSE